VNQAPRAFLALPLIPSLPVVNPHGPIKACPELPPGPIKVFLNLPELPITGCRVLLVRRIKVCHVLPV
jgi:hypothetical protein